MPIDARLLAIVANPESPADVSVPEGNEPAWGIDWSKQLEGIYFVWGLCIIIPVVVLNLGGFPVWDFFKNPGWYALMFPGAVLVPWVVHYGLRWILMTTGHQNRPSVTG